MQDYSTAIQDFRRARSRAALKEMMARLTGKSIELMSYEDVRQKLRTSGVESKSIQNIPLDAIVGSVGRYQDFTRDFLPRQDSDADRWARVKVATHDLAGLPPVEVYQIGEAYFVYDGHHRVSVARQLGTPEIQAYVTKIRTKVPISAETTPEDLILKAEYVEFLTTTGLDEIRPDAALEVTCAGQFGTLLEHIEVHRHYMGNEQQREIPYREAVAHWYDTVYMPVVEIIRELGILHEFPKRTEADLYLWVGSHRADIEQMLGWDIPYSSAAVDLVDQQGKRWSRVVSRLSKRVLEVVLPDELESEPASGQFRREIMAEQSKEHIFSDILVALNGTESGWETLEQAIEIARREGGRLRGLHVVADEQSTNSADVYDIRDRFYWRCGEFGLPAKFVVESGSVSRNICSLARWSDLVVVNLSHPPQGGPLSKLSSGFRTLLKQCTRPILAVPEKATSLSRPILAYDGSPKAREALFVATYISGQWQVPLIVVSVSENGDVDQGTLEEARQYLEEHEVMAEYRLLEGQAAEMVLKTAEDMDCDVILIGGYGRTPVVELVLGTQVDEILRSSRLPVLICH